MKAWRRGSLLAAALLALAGLAGQAHAGQVLYVTSLEDGLVEKVDVGTNAISTVATFGTAVDSLAFTDSTHLLVTEINAGNLVSVDTTTGIITSVASGFNGPRDVTLDPGGATALVSDFGNGRLARVDLTTHAVSTLSTAGNFDGTTYVGGDLFAVLDRSTVVQLNPVTGAIVQSRTIGGSLDGLTYDSASGRLLVADFNGAVHAMDPDLSAGVLRSYGAPSGTDGIEVDGNGNLFIASRDFHVYELNLTSGALTQETFVHGLDDLAPVVGLGSPNPVPEPATLAGAGTAVLLGLMYGWRRRVRCTV